MKDRVIVGLGNPGSKYQKNRHNVGFLFLDFYAKEKLSSDFTEEKSLSVLKSEFIHSDQKVILLKPQKFINCTGDSIIKFCQYYKIQKEQIIFVYDDKDMDFNTIKYKKTGNSGGHNGIKNIISHFGSDFERIKIGVANEFLAKKDTADFVLQDFSKEEEQILYSDIFPAVSEKLDEVLNFS